MEIVGYVGWKSKPYALETAKLWVKELVELYPRASDSLASICAKSPEDIAKMASLSQFGWETFKKYVKKIDKLQNRQKTPETAIPKERFHSLWRITIQLLSSDVMTFLFFKKMLYPAEVSYLTSWYRELL